jgi:alkylated DNA repair dioxygenase AlkB
MKNMLHWDTHIDHPSGSWLRSSSVKGLDIHQLAYDCMPTLPLNERPVIVIAGRPCQQNRFVSFFSDVSQGYQYSGSVAEAKPLTPQLSRLLKAVNRAMVTSPPDSALPVSPSLTLPNASHLQQPASVLPSASHPQQLVSTPPRFNAILVNGYETGEHSISAHSDRVDNLVTPDILTLSIGECRTFRIRERGTKAKVLDLPLEDGSLCLMSGDFQSYYTHEIPVEKRRTNPRVSFTFRHHRS